MPQFSAVSGLRRRPTYVDQINARTPYLRGRKRLKESKEYDAKMLGLKEDELAQNEKISREALELREEQGKRSNIIAATGLGVNAYLGHKRNKAMDDIMFGDSDKVDTGGGAIRPSPSFADVPSELPESGLDKISGSFGKGKTYATGIGGGLTGARLGKSIGGSLGIGGEKEQATVGGALVAGGLEYFSGGDIYSSIASGLIGGVTGYVSTGGWWS